MELRQLRTFRAVVEQGSLLRAAGELGYAQSTVTLHIQQLEAELGAALFHRGGRRLQLTEVGAELYDRAGDILARVEELRQGVGDLISGEGGHVRIGCIEPSASLRVTPLLARFCAERPKVRLTVEVGGTRTISDRVARKELDAALCSPPPAELGLAFEPLFVEAMALVAPESHPLAGKDTIAAADLSGHRLLLSERACAYRAAIERALREQGTDPYAGYELGNIEIGGMEALKRAVQSGLGVAILPAAVVSPPPVGTVVRDLRHPALGLQVGLASRPGTRPHSRALDALLSMLRQRVGQEGE